MSKALFLPGLAPRNLKCVYGGNDGSTEDLLSRGSWETGQTAAVGGSWLLARPVLMLEGNSWERIRAVKRGFVQTRGEKKRTVGIRHDGQLLPPE
jgi:hypothetical protein